MRETHSEGVGQIGFRPTAKNVPSYLMSGSAPGQISLCFACGWTLHLPLTADSGAYLRRLAAVAATCADMVEETAASPGRHRGRSRRFRASRRASGSPAQQPKPTND